MVAPLPTHIGPEQADLLSRRVALVVGSRDERQCPHLAHASGCRLSADRRILTVLLPLEGAAQVLADLHANGRIALVCSEPSTNRTLQLKGEDARIVPVTAEDEAQARAHLQRFSDEIAALGFATDVACTMHALEEGLAAVRFTIAEAYEQTPGPQAGTRLPAAGA